LILTVFTEHGKIPELLMKSSMILNDAIPTYGKEKARLQSLGQIISDFDLLIGCTSIENDLIMVTENVKEFQRIDGIKIENWVKR